MPATLNIPYGRGEISVSFPQEWDVRVVETNKNITAVPLQEAIEAALENPIGSGKLREIVKKGQRVAIAINDVTRPVPSREMVLALAGELYKGGIVPEDICLVVATGTHRFCTRAELEDMLGADLCGQFEIVQHDSRDPETMILTGRTGAGLSVLINRSFAEADVRIVTGAIVPHQTAGFSGGRKSVVPGLAGAETIRKHHSFPIRPFGPSMGFMEGNPFHHQAVEAARLIGVDFLLNVIPDGSGGYAGAVAGDLEAAHLHGVKICTGIASVPVTAPADVVICSPGGYPRDIDLYQTQKAIAVAEQFVREGGVIIAVAECQDGIQHDAFYQWLAGAATPAEVVERYGTEGFLPGSNVAFMIARARLKARIIVVSGLLPAGELDAMFMEGAATWEAAVKMAEVTAGTRPKCLAFPRAVYLMPAECGG